MGAYKQRVLELFDLIDTSRSGFVDPGDLAPRSEGQSAEQVQRGEAVGRIVTEIIRSSDSNKDGKLSKDEMLHWVERTMVGKTPETLPDPVKNLARAVFAFMDADGSGKVGKAEFEKYLKARNSSSAGAVEEFAKLDGDGDGTLVRSDIDKAIFRFFTAPESDCPQQWLRAFFKA